MVNQASKSKATRPSALSSKEARAKRLKQLRQLTGKDKPLTRATLERKYGVSAHTLRNWETAHGVGLTKDGARRAINMYKQEQISCSITWLLEGVGAPPERSLSKTETINKNPDYTDPLTTMREESETFLSLHPEGILLEIKDDAMAPIYLSGDIVGGVRYYGNDISQWVNHDCILESAQGDVWLRRLQVSTIPGQYNLYALNPNTKIARPTIYSVELTTASPVMRHWRGKKWCQTK